MRAWTLIELFRLTRAELFGLYQEIVNALARERTRRVRVHAGGFVDHQQMLVFKYDAGGQGS